MKQSNWFERKFEFNVHENIMPSIIERLEGTPIRLNEKMKYIDPSILTLKPEGKWSILEQIGHLSDLEPLWQVRMDDILDNKEELTAADLQNRKTHEANHNQRSVRELIDEFTRLRKITLEKIKTLKEEDIFRSALHPRLKTPMRILDHFIFVAEHDDHHLAKITEMIQLIRPR